jgi:hypothetical protein
MIRVLAVAILVVTTQTGCIAIGLTLLGAAVGVGSGTAVSYALNGYAYRTFALPLNDVEKATLRAMGEMGMRLEGREKTDDGKLLHAAGNEREIEVRLEEVTSKATRIRTKVRVGTFLMDRATATEIIIQTEEVLART